VYAGRATALASPFAEAKRQGSSVE
jgi:hypothetical protein